VSKIVSWPANSQYKQQQKQNTTSLTGPYGYILQDTAYLMHVEQTAALLCSFSTN